jgi:hypothetical protein
MIEKGRWFRSDTRYLLSSHSEPPAYLAAYQFASVLTLRLAASALLSSWTSPGGGMELSRPLSARRRPSRSIWHTLIHSMARESGLHPRRLPHVPGDGAQQASERTATLPLGSLVMRNTTRMEGHRALVRLPYALLDRELEPHPNGLAE